MNDMIRKQVWLVILRLQQPTVVCKEWLNFSDNPNIMLLPKTQRK